jgi:transcriptional antiterminator RfaH
LSNKNWYVVHTKPRKENVALDNLERQGFIVYCPKTVQSKHRRHHWQKVTIPLFPRYIFVQLNVGKDNFSPIRSTLGVIGLVRFGGEPAVMPESAIKAIQYQECELKNIASELPTWQKGDVLEILEGPFAGIRGIFQRRESIDRVSLLLDILGQQNRFTVNADSLVPVY